MTNTETTKYLEVVVHPGAHKLPEGVVSPLSDPAVDSHAFCPEADGLRLEFTLLQEKRGGAKVEMSLSFAAGEKLKRRCRRLALTSTALSTSLNTDRCFLLSVLALCLLQSVASVFSLSHSSSQSWNSKSCRGTDAGMHKCKLIFFFFFKNRRKNPPTKLRVFALGRGWGTYTVHVSGQLEQEGDGLSCSDSHVDVLTFQQLWQFRQVPATQTLHFF